MAKLISRTYGEALFETACQEAVLDEVAIELSNTKKAIDDNEDLIRLLNHPKIINEEKIALIEKIFKGNVSDLITGFLVTIVKKGRYNQMNEIFDYFFERVKMYKGIGVAYVTSAIDLTDTQKINIEKRLIETTEYSKFEMNYSVDKDIIGGLIIRIGDRVVDSSIKTKIYNLSRELYKLQIS